MTPTRKGKRQPIYVIGPSIAYMVLTKGAFACVELDDVPYLAQRNWSTLDTKGNRFAVRNGGKQGFLYMHRELVPTDRGIEVDHRNRCTLDNRRIGNLREATKSQNQCNRDTRNANPLGLKGVVWVPSRKRYVVNLKLNGKSKYVGRFTTIEAAVIARKAASEVLHGEFVAKI